MVCAFLKRVFIALVQSAFNPAVETRQQFQTQPHTHTHVQTGTHKCKKKKSTACYIRMKFLQSIVYINTVYLNKLCAVLVQFFLIKASGPQAPYKSSSILSGEPDSIPVHYEPPDSQTTGLLPVCPCVHFDLSSDVMLTRILIGIGISGNVLRHSCILYRSLVALCTLCCIHFT